VFQPLPQAEAHFRSLGATDCPDWRGPEQLPSLQFTIEALDACSKALAQHEQPESKD
jgi:hypothetical protein